MTLKQAIDKYFDDYYADEDVWNDFVAYWIEKNPCDVFEIVSDHLNKIFTKNNSLQVKFDAFVRDRIESEWEASFEE